MAGWKTNGTAPRDPGRPPARSPANGTDRVVPYGGVFGGGLPIADAAQRLKAKRVPSHRHLPSSNAVREVHAGQTKGNRRHRLRN